METQPIVRAADSVNLKSLAGVVDLLKVAKHGAGRRVFFIEFRYVAARRRSAP